MTRDLVEAAQRGDHGAFEALTAVRVDRLFTVARLILRDVHLAEDAVQETLIRTWQRCLVCATSTSSMRGCIGCSSTRAPIRAESVDGSPLRLTSLASSRRRAT